VLNTEQRNIEEAKALARKKDVKHEGK